MAGGARRIAIDEYGSPVSITAQAAQSSLEPDQLRAYLNRASSRIASNLGIKNAITFGEGTFQLTDVAGLLRLAPGLDLEIKPKFLRGHDQSWREDFFCIAVLSRYGRVLPRDAIASTESAGGDLADLLARAMISMYDHNRRRPLRSYNHSSWKSFHIDGEIEPESTLLPDEEGFRQSGLRLDRENPFNEYILRAMTNLIPDLRDGDTRRLLAHRRLELSPQKPQKRSPPRVVPSRHRRWQDLYDLARHICNGFGLGFGQQQNTNLPGFIIRTADAWESLLITALRIGLRNYEVVKKLHPFGTKFRVGRTATKLYAEPDVTIVTNKNALLLDGKYKTVVAENQAEIVRADMYEALGFMKAANCRRALLLYPAAEALSRDAEPGRCVAFERVSVGDYEVIGLLVEPRGLSKPGGFGQFCHALATNIEPWNGDPA